MDTPRQSCVTDRNWLGHLMDDLYCPRPYDLLVLAAEFYSIKHGILTQLDESRSKGTVLSSFLCYQSDQYQDLFVYLLNSYTVFLPSGDLKQVG